MRIVRVRELGPDAVVEIDRVGNLTDALRSAAPGGVNVTIDLLWGEPGLAAMGAAARFARHVQVGGVVASELALPAPPIRSVSLDVLGFSVAHPPIEVKRDGYLRVTEHAARGDITVDVEPVAIEDIARAWERQRRAAGGPKLVVIPDAAARREETTPT